MTCAECGDDLPADHDQDDPRLCPSCLAEARWQDGDHDAYDRAGDR